jgi:hypothetical protein
MMLLQNKILPTNIQTALNRLQNDVNLLSTFTERVDKAKSLWNTKGGATGKKAFETVKTCLQSMCISVEVCNYCEANEAGDIEHIAAKTFFPELAFVWDNYLLACKTCNSVWESIKVEHIVMAKWKRVFEQVPEALYW